MSAPLRAVLFDWDGTLSDSAEASFRCYARLFPEYGIPFERDDYRRTYSPDWYRTYTQLGLAREHWDAADARWLEYYTVEPAIEMAGAIAAVRALGEAGLKLGLVTSGSRSRVERELQGLDLARLFEVILCAGDTEERKPHPAPLRAALERMDVAPHQGAYVGDSPEDIQMARAAGVFAIGIPGPFPNRDLLEASAPDLLVNDLASAVAALLARR
jgi:phosphoglycolate phosphatase